MSKRSWKIVSAALLVLLVGSLCFAYAEHQAAARERATAAQLEFTIWQLHYQLLEAHSQSVCPLSE